MNWNELTDIEQLETIKQESEKQPILIFKHSTRCSISSMAKNRLERAWNFDAEKVKPYYLDLIAFRNISNEIATLFGVEHQSPQVLLIKGGDSVFDASHNLISVADLEPNCWLIIAYK